MAECLRDFLQIGINCIVYNESQDQLLELAQALIIDARESFENEFHTTFAFANGVETLEKAKSIVKAQRDAMGKK